MNITFDSCLLAIRTNNGMPNGRGNHFYSEIRNCFKKVTVSSAIGKM